MERNIRRCIDGKVLRNADVQRGPFRKGDGPADQKLQRAAGQFPQFAAAVEGGVAGELRLKGNYLRRAPADADGAESHYVPLLPLQHVAVAQAHPADRTEQPQMAARRQTIVVAPRQPEGKVGAAAAVKPGARAGGEFQAGTQSERPRVLLAIVIQLKPAGKA